LAAAGVGLLLARPSKAKSPAWVASAAQKSYEFYLLHPIAFLAFKEVAGFGFLLNLFAGTASTVVGVEAMETGLGYAEMWIAALVQLALPRSAPKETATEAAACVSNSPGA
jgi:peptidoglycan/LPS O-acetylase OafA/YrhL